MNRLFDYFFGPIIDKDGKRKEFNRFDIALGAVFIFSSIITVAYWAQRNTPMESEDWHRIGIAGGISAFILVISRFRMEFIATALLFAGVRLVAVPFGNRSPFELVSWWNGMSAHCRGDSEAEGESELTLPLFPLIPHLKREMWGTAF